MDKEKAFTVINPPGFPQQVGVYSYMVKIKPGASILMLSGLCGRDEKGDVKGDIKGQTERVLQRIENLLSQAHATLDDIVMLRIFLADADDKLKCDDVLKKHFKVPPPNTVMVVKRTCVDLPGGLIEIEATAAVME